jgi:hypothetical protein
MLLLTLACSGADRGEVAEAGYAGADGSEIHLAPPDAPDDAPIIVRVEEGLWALREGTRWADAVELGEYEVSLDDGLWVDLSHMLPDSVEAGATGDGVEVVEMGERSTWYGTFPDVATVLVDEGPFAGEGAFARGVGPIALTYDGALWEAVWYQ